MRQLAGAIILQAYRDLRSTDKKQEMQEARADAEEFLYSDERASDRECLVRMAKLSDEALTLMANLAPATVRQQLDGNAWAGVIPA